MKNKNGTYPCFFSKETGMKVNMEVNFLKENYTIKTQQTYWERRNCSCSLKAISPFPTLILDPILLFKK